MPFGDDVYAHYAPQHLCEWRAEDTAKDLVAWLEQHSQTLVDHAQKLASQFGRPCEYRQGRFKKESSSRRWCATRSSDRGLVAVLCVQETCRTVKLLCAKGKLRLAFARREL